MQRFRLRSLICSLLCIFSGHAIADEPPPPDLKLDTALKPAPPGAKDTTPVFIRALRLQGHQDEEIEAEGEAELRKRGQALFADWMMYFPGSDEVYAEGHVRLEQRGDLLEGPKLRLNLETERGQMETPSYHLVENDARGRADLLLFEGENKFRLRVANYTTCPEGNDDWYLRVTDLEVDRNRQVGTARNASIVFKGMPILYTPWMDFSLGKERRSGFLAPIFGSTANGGPELTVPYYWNIAPNRDATISPRLMVKRGLMLNNEFRYLERSYQGEAHFDILPADRVANTNRYGLNLVHTHQLPGAWSGSLNVQKVSDDAYFRDLSDRIAVTSQTSLLRQGVLSRGGNWWTDGSWAFSAMVQRFQTLQDPLAPITPPYERTPQLALSAVKRDIRGADFSFSGSFVDFSHPTLANGKRWVVYPSASYPLQTWFGYLTPKIGLHSTRYVLDSSTTTLPDATRTVPIFSLDSGVVFERELSLRGERFLQTLEPRLYYVKVPFRDQSGLPNFDSGETDFNFAQIFTENRFSGEDRIGDASQVTLAVTSRLIEPDSGNERLRVAVGQRYYFKDAQVVVSAPARTDKKSDILFAASGKLIPQVSVDAGWQYNPNLSRNEKVSLNGRYQPELGKVVNLGYRFTRDTLRQVDASVQWPLSGRWHGVARLNYSLQDGRILEGLAGLEYNGGCWMLRLVVQRFATATQEAATAIFVQLELNGLTQIGSNPLEVLRQSIPGYTKLNVPAAKSEPADWR